VLVAECIVVAVQDHYKSVEAEEEEQIKIAKALSIMDQIPEDKTPEGKIPALSEEDFKKQQQFAKDQESLERQLRNQEDEKIEMGISTDPIPLPLKSNENEEIPGTPEQKHEPTIVTPKDLSNAYAEEIILNDDREVSILTAPSAVLAGPNSEASHESDVSTVTSDIVEQSVNQPSVASATRAMPPRSCKKSKPPL
jgi:hypothetical protein